MEPSYTGYSLAFSSEGTQCALCNKSVVTVHNTESRAIMAEVNVGTQTVHHCCFSPNGSLIAASIGTTAYVWDITSSIPCLIETFIGHTEEITALAFSSPSSLISMSAEKVVKFWKFCIPTE